MKRQFNACQTPRSTYPSIFNSFRVIRTASAKNSRFRVPQPTFLFPLETPLRLPPYISPWMKRQLDDCQTPRSMCLSIFNSFRVIRCLSKCVSAKKITIFIIFLFPWAGALVVITSNVIWMERELGWTDTG